MEHIYNIAGSIMVITSAEMTAGCRSLSHMADLNLSSSGEPLILTEGPDHWLLHRPYLILFYKTENKTENQVLYMFIPFFLLFYTTLLPIINKNKSFCIYLYI